MTLLSIIVPRLLNTCVSHRMQIGNYSMYYYYHCIINECDRVKPFWVEKWKCSSSEIHSSSTLLEKISSEQQFEAKCFFDVRADSKKI